MILCSLEKVDTMDAIYLVSQINWGSNNQSEIKEQILLNKYIILFVSKNLQQPIKIVESERLPMLLIKLASRPVVENFVWLPHNFSTYS